MEGSLVFNSEAFSALDAWVGGGAAAGQDTATRAAEQDDHQPQQPRPPGQQQHQAQHGRWKRAGVGAATVKPKEAATQAEATGSLQKLVMGHRSKKKREREAAEAEVAAAAAAADAEEDEGEALDDSKARMFGTASSATPLANKHAAVAEEDAPKKKNNKKRKKKAHPGPVQGQEPEAEGGEEMGKAAAEEGQAPAPVPQTKTHTQRPQQPAMHHPQHQKRAPNALPNKPHHGGGDRDGAAQQQQGQQQGQQRPRKRTKTRSKQKNIRRDTRPVDQRPEHLRPGHAAFAGRGMTDETRKRLGVKGEGGGAEM